MRKDCGKYLQQNMAQKIFTVSGTRGKLGKLYAKREALSEAISALERFQQLREQRERRNFGTEPSRCHPRKAA
jgi:hypothetical protein